MVEFIKGNCAQSETQEIPKLKGIVQRDLTWVKTRLKRSVLMNYIVAKFAFLILKEHHHERSTKLVSASKQQLN